jgi:hypothetical protein
MRKLTVSIELLRGSVLATVQEICLPMLQTTGFRDDDDDVDYEIKR